MAKLLDLLFIYNLPINNLYFNWICEKYLLAMSRKPLGKIISITTLSLKGK